MSHAISAMLACTKRRAERSTFRLLGQKLHYDFHVICDITTASIALQTIDFLFSMASFPFHPVWHVHSPVSLLFALKLRVMEGLLMSTLSNYGGQVADGTLAFFLIFNCSLARCTMPADGGIDGLFALHMALA